MRLVTTRRQLKKWVAKAAFKQFRIFTDTLVGIEVLKSRIVMNKPIYIGFTILELSKMLMYEFHYGYIKCQYPGDQSQLCYTDTDSLIYEITTEDLYGDILKHGELFDTSDYPKDHPAYSDINKKVCYIKI